MNFDAQKYTFAFNFDNHCCYAVKTHHCSLSIQSKLEDTVETFPIQGTYSYCKELGKYISNITDEELQVLMKQDGDLKIFKHKCGHYTTNHQHRLCVIAHLGRTFEFPDIIEANTNKCPYCRNIGWYLYKCRTGLVK